MKKEYINMEIKYIKLSDEFIRDFHIEPKWLEVYAIPIIFRYQILLVLPNNT